MTDKEKWELVITDTVKIQQHDNYNFTVLKLSKGVNPRNQQEVETYKVLGYYSSVRLAILSLLTKDTLVDLDTVKTLTAYSKASKKQYDYVTELLEGTYEQ